MAPKPTEREKKIWPAAASQSCGLRRPAATSLGFHM